MPNNDNPIPGLIAVGVVLYVGYKIVEKISEAEPAGVASEVTPIQNERVLSKPRIPKPCSKCGAENPRRCSMCGRCGKCYRVTGGYCNVCY